MDARLIVPLLAGFFVTFLLLPWWIKKAKSIKLVWDDVQKGTKKNVAGSGGITVLLGFIIAIFIYIAIKTFYFKNTENLIEILALTSSILLLGGVGIIDDLLGWQRGGLSKKMRLLICIVAAIPLMVINAGYSNVSLPFLGKVSLGLWYPLLLIPIGIIATSTTFNFLAGLNGLEASQGILILSALSIVAYFTGNPWLSLIGFSMVFCLVGFIIFNWNPAKIFPGDVLTYPVGGLIGILAILGNFEKIAIFFFIPYIIEVGLKSRGGLKKPSFGKLKSDGSLGLRDNKFYSLTHLAIYLLEKYKKNKKCDSETQVVLLINAFQIIIILLGFLIFRNAIFI